MALSFLLIILLLISSINYNETLIFNTKILNNGFKNEVLINLAKIEKEVYVKIIELNRTIIFNNTKIITLTLMDDEIINFNELNLIIYSNKEESKIKIPIKILICKLFYIERIGSNIFIYYMLEPHLSHKFIVFINEKENDFTIKEEEIKPILLKNIPINSTIVCTFKILDEKSIFIEPKNFTINEEILINIEKNNNSILNINIFNKTPNLYLRNIPILINTSKERISQLIEYLPPNEKYSIPIENAIIENLKISLFLEESLNKLKEETNVSKYEEENEGFKFNGKFLSFILFLSFIIIFITFENRRIEERGLNNRPSKKL